MTIMHFSKSKQGALPKEFPKILKFPFPFYMRFNVDQINSLKTGLNPQSMDDHWATQYNKGNLEFYRSWTGCQVYKLKIIHSGNGALCLWGWISLSSLFFALRLLLLPFHIILLYFLIWTIFKQNREQNHINEDASNSNSAAGKTG